MRTFWHRIRQSFWWVESVPFEKLDLLLRIRQALWIPRTSETIHESPHRDTGFQRGTALGGCPPRGSALRAQTCLSSMMVPPTAPPRFSHGNRTSRVLTHPQNRGYGAALISAFAHAVDSDYDVLITMDCDGQHEPSRIPVLLEALDSQNRHRERQPLSARFSPDIAAHAAGSPPDQSDHHLGTERHARPPSHRRLLRLQSVSPRGPRKVAHHGNRLGHAACSFGCKRRFIACASRRSACRGFTSIQTGRSAAGSTTRKNGSPIIAA